MTREQARAVAVRALRDVGDKSHEWHEWSGYAFHIRRRLTIEEQATVGPVVDCRGTSDGKRRLAAVANVIPEQAIELAMQEIGG